MSDTPEKPETGSTLPAECQECPAKGDWASPECTNVNCPRLRTALLEQAEPPPTMPDKTPPSEKHRLSMDDEPSTLSCYDGTQFNGVELGTPPLPPPTASTDWFCTVCNVRVNAGDDHECRTPADDPTKKEQAMEDTQTPHFTSACPQMETPYCGDTKIEIRSQADDRPDVEGIRTQAQAFVDRHVAPPPGAGKVLRLCDYILQRERRAVRDPTALRLWKEMDDEERAGWEVRLSPVPDAVEPRRPRVPAALTEDDDLRDMVEHTARSLLEWAKEAPPSSSAEMIDTATVLLAALRESD